MDKLRLWEVLSLQKGPEASQGWNRGLDPSPTDSGDPGVLIGSYVLSLMRMKQYTWFLSAFNYFLQSLRQSRRNLSQIASCCYRCLNYGVVLQGVDQLNQRGR